MRAPVSPITPRMDKLSETQSDTAGSRLKGNEILFGGRRSEGGEGGSKGRGEGGGGGGTEGWRGTRWIIETGRVQLGIEIEMLSPSRAYHHQRQRGQEEKPIKESKHKYEELCRKVRRRRSTRRREKKKMEGNAVFF